MNKADDTCTTFTGAVDYGPFNVKAVAIDASGGKWFGTYGGGVSYLDDNESPWFVADDIWTTFTADDDGLADDSVLAVAIDASGGKWFGTYWVSCLNDNETPINKGDDTWTIYDYDDGLVGGVQAIAIDASGESGLGRTMG